MISPCICIHIPLFIQVDVSVLDGKEICLNGSHQRVLSEEKVCIIKLCILFAYNLYKNCSCSPIALLTDF